MIELKGLSMDLGEFHLRRINLSIGDQEYFIILGPTGAGKTVLVECIAGLHKIKQGEVWIDGRNVTPLTPEERHIGYVPQDYVLFPFLNVADNIAFSLKEAKYPPPQIKRRVEYLANLTGITHLLGRDTRSLSGGEKQRVALARALALAPQILLLDEPLSSLDIQTARYLRLMLRRIHDELGITTIHITHNQIEAEEIADRIGVMNCGMLEQVGYPEEIFFYPGTDAVSSLIGSPNILECKCCTSLGQGLMEVDCSGLRIILPHDGNSVQRIAIFPRDIYLSVTPPPGPHINRYRGTITDIKPSATSQIISVEVARHNLLAEVPHDIAKEMELGVGKEVYLILKMKRIRAYECHCPNGKKNRDNYVLTGG